MKTIGKFELVWELGRTPMGVVHQARDTASGALVTLKTLPPGLAHEADMQERFERQAEILKSLHHPNIIALLESGSEDDEPYLIFEYLDGQFLDRLIERKQPVSLAEKLGYLVSVASALECIHENGYIHADLKPAAIFIQKDGMLKITGFDLARAAGATKRQRWFRMIGTLGYISPERVRGVRADVRADIWALGGTAYELLACQKPFGGENLAAMMMSILTEPPRSLASAAPGIPQEVVSVVERMLRKNADERFQTAKEARLALEPLWDRARKGSGPVQNAASA